MTEFVDTLLISITISLYSAFLLSWVSLSVIYNGSSPSTS